MAAVPIGGGGRFGEDIHCRVRGKREVHPGAEDLAHYRGSVLPFGPWGNKKRPLEERDHLFQAMLAQRHYIMEDAGRDCFRAGMEQADTVLLLEIPRIVREKRILLRWVKQNLGLEKCIYRPRFAMLQAMFRWARNYDTGADGTKALVSQFASKTIVLRNGKDIRRYLQTLSRVAE